MQQGVNMDQQTVSAGTSPAGSATPGAASALDALGVMLRQEFDDAEKLRKSKEDGWLRDLRQFKGIYDPDVMARMHPKRSKVFIRLTRAKVRSSDARMAKLLFPAGDRNWAMDKTPVVELEPETHLTALAEVMQKLGLVDPTQLPPKAALDAVNALATDRMQSMQTEIDDQLTEGNYKAEARKVLHSGHLYGTGILKGPLVERRDQRRWKPAQTEPGQPAPAEQFALSTVEVKAPGFSMRPVWAIYPDPYATQVSECQYIWDRHTPNKHELLDLARRNKFNMDVVYGFVHNNPAGDTRQRHWETDLISIGDREHVGALKNRYDLLERWGYLYGKDLAGAGLMDATKMSAEEMHQEYESRLFLLGNRVVKVALNPLPSKIKPFHFYYFDKDDSSIWGNSIPEIYRDSQTSFNSAVRVTIDNAAIAGGPQIEVNRELMEDEEDIEDVHPFRLWVRTGTGQEAQAPAVRIYEVASHAAENMQMAKMFKDLGDEAVTIPSFTYGESSAGVAKTVGGLSMLMGQANITMEEPARNWDDVRLEHAVQPEAGNQGRLHGQGARRVGAGGQGVAPARDTGFSCRHQQSAGRALHQAGLSAARGREGA
jgi:hypothetical protein